MPSFLNAMTRQIPSSSIHAATQKAEAYRREGKKVVIFSIGRPDFDTPAHIKEAAKAALDKGYVHYTPNMGILPLREAVAEHIKRQTGVSYDPKTEVMITCGGQQAILLTMKAVLEPGDEVLLPSPGYGLYYNCAAIADAQVRAYALKAPDFGWGGAEAGERTKMLFINSPHNPTGAVLSKEELGQIADFAKANNLLVVSDEAYDRLLYDGLEHRSIASEPGMRDRTVILGSFSKTYSMTGWRLGYLAGPAEVIRGMALLQQSFVLSVNSFAQWGAVEAMTGPQDCVEEMRQQFDIRRKAMMEALRSRGLWIGVATTDDLKSTRRCLEVLGVEEYISFWGVSGEGLPEKPDGRLVSLAAGHWGIWKDEIAMVGDNPNDMRFARNGGAVAIGVKSGTGTEDMLREQADYLLDSVGDLVDLIDQINTEEKRNGTYSVKACV